MIDLKLIGKYRYIKILPLVDVSHFKEEKIMDILE